MAFKDLLALAARYAGGWSACARRAAGAAGHLIAKGAWVDSSRFIVSTWFNICKILVSIDISYHAGLFHKKWQ